MGRGIDGKGIDGKGIEGKGVEGKGLVGKGIEGKGDGQAVRGTVEPCCCLRVVLGCCPLLLE